ncbi:MAG: TetR/AcrR family transcriptional regulator, partial [Chloroflexota bacterium]
VRHPVRYHGHMRSDTLTREQIVRAAIDLLDAEGLDGLNMRALGKRLGSAPTAVYWHLGGKDDLVALAGDQAWNEITLPDLTTTDWRSVVTSLATDLYAMLTRHPWLVRAFGSFVVYGPGKARYDDHSIAVFEAAGFTGPGADQAATTILTYVLGHALGSAATATLRRKLSRGGDQAEKLMGEKIARAREIATRFPRLRVRLDTAGADYAASPEGSFAFGLRAILDGLEVQLIARV